MSFQAKMAPARPGIISVQVFDNFEKGDKDILERADFIAEQFRSVVERDVTFGAASVGQAKREGNKWKILITSPWRADIIC